MPTTLEISRSFGVLERELGTRIRYSLCHITGSNDSVLNSSTDAYIMVSELSAFCQGRKRTQFPSSQQRDFETAWPQQSHTLLNKVTASFVSLANDQPRGMDEKFRTQTSEPVLLLRSSQLPFPLVALSAPSSRFTQGSPALFSLFLGQWISQD